MILPHSPFLNKLVYLLNEIKNICFSNINRNLLQLRLTNSMMMGEKPVTLIYLYLYSMNLLFLKFFDLKKISTIIFIPYEKKNVYVFSPLV